MTHDFDPDHDRDAGLDLLATAEPGPDEGADADAASGADGATDAAPATGIVVQMKTLAPIASSPVIAADGTVYVGTTDGKLVALSSDFATVKWSATTNDTTSQPEPGSKMSPPGRGPKSATATMTNQPRTGSAAASRLLSPQTASRPTAQFATPEMSAPTEM